MPPEATIRAAEALLAAGELAQGWTTESFEITGTEPILVGQFIVSQTAPGVDTVQGDPAFVLAVPVEQLRTEYVVLTPERYREDWITVTKPTGAVVTLDDAVLPEADFTPIAQSGFSFAWRSVEPGNHSLVGDAPFAVTMFGYGSAVSYGYPGGLDLTRDEDR